LYCSGQIGRDPATGKLESGVVSQTQRSLDNLSEVLKAVGFDMSDVVKTTVFMVDLSEFSTMNEEYSRHFSKPFPARSTVQVAALPGGARVEIEAIATK
jgi:2-iminobutanoate/2-iminopropanoate deaminase